jgi:hypothetical protein
MWCSLYLCCLLVAGYPVVAATARERSWVETAGLCACVGPGIVGIFLIFLSMLGLRPQRGEILAIAGVCLAAGIALHRRPIAAGAGGKVSRLWAGVCLLAIAYGLFAVVTDALGYPVIEWDAFAIWQLKARVLTLAALSPRPGYFPDVNLSFSHLRYPLLEPMMSAGANAMAGSVGDWGKMLALLLYPGMGAAVFATVRRFNGTTAALTATALLMCLEPMCRYGGSGTAEMALAGFYACSLLCMLRWRETGAWGHLILASLLSAWMAWTKDEGLALAAINVVVAAGMKPPGSRRRALAAAGVMAGIVAAIYLPWVIYSWGLPRTDENYLGNLTVHAIISNARRIPAILGALAVEMINWQDWGLFWVVVVSMAIVQRRRLGRPIVGAVGVLLGLHLLAYFPPLMVVRSWNLNELLGVTTDRLLMHAAPAAAILIGLLWPGWAGGTGAA